MNQEARWLLEEKYDGTESEAFRADLERLKTGTPLAYLIGSVPFLNCTIHLDSHPLIPRSETEFWTERAIETIKKYPAQGMVRVLDLCAGSGAVGVAVAHAIPLAQVTFGEIETEHLATIAKNLEAHNIPCTRYQVFASDLFENIGGTFDFILTNPPYIDPILDRTETSVKAHEPHSALYGGTDGMELIKRIIIQAPEYLTQNGQLWIEHEPEQVSAITALAKENDFSCVTHNDQYNTARYSVLTRTTLE